MIVAQVRRALAVSRNGASGSVSFARSACSGSAIGTRNATAKVLDTGCHADAVRGARGTNGGTDANVVGACETRSAVREISIAISARADAGVAAL